MSLGAYVERVNAIVGQAFQRYEALAASDQGKVLMADAAHLGDFAPQDLQVALQHVEEIEVELLGAVDAIKPPAQVADLHGLLFDAKFTAVEKALAARAGTAETWEELSATTEMVRYRAALAADKQLCIDFEAKLDSTAGQGAFGGGPWIPVELEEVAEAVLGCAGYPEQPEDIYRPPASSP